MKNYAISAVIALVVALFGVQFVPSKVIEKVGAVSSPNLMSPWMTFGDVRNWAGHTESLNQASTTICAIQSPAATSTLVFASIDLKVSSTTASLLTMAKDTTPSATTTWLSTSDAVSANGQYAMSLPATTTETGMDKYIFAPNTYFTVGMSGGTGTFSPTGTCQAKWVQTSY
jgi:hypothetical protein